MALLAVFKVDGENRTVNAVLIAIGSVVGLALLLNCRTWWQVTDSVLNSQRKRLHSAANRMHKLKSEGFMKVRGGLKEHSAVLLWTAAGREIREMLVEGLISRDLF